MSYRTYLKSLSVKTYSSISKFKTEEEIINYINKHNKKDDYLNNNEINLAFSYIEKDLLQILETGPYLDNFMISFFNNNYINSIPNNYGQELFMIKKDGLKQIIERYNKEILISYQKSMDDLNNCLKGEELNINNLKYFINKTKRKLHNKLFDFGGLEGIEDHKLYNFNDGLILIDNESLEYEIFNLINLYKNFDWNNEIMFIQAG